MDRNTTYPEREEKLNVYTHAFGLIMSVVGLILLIIKANTLGGSLYVISFMVFGLSLIILYAASTFYHNAKDENHRRLLNIFDHSAIFVLIAGTYTPFTLITLKGEIGWIVFGITWGIALVGIILKLFFTGRFNVLSTTLYVLMGWIIVFAIKPLIQNLPEAGLLWLLGGGVAYTIGAVLVTPDLFAVLS